MQQPGALTIELAGSPNIMGNVPKSARNGARTAANLPLLRLGGGNRLREAYRMCRARLGPDLRREAAGTIEISGQTAT
jgi:hypothetical protein